MARSFEELRKKLPLKSQKLAAVRTQDLLQQAGLVIKAEFLGGEVEVNRPQKFEGLGEGDVDGV